MKRTPKFLDFAMDSFISYRRMAAFILAAAFMGCLPMTQATRTLKAPNDASKWTIALQSTEPTGAASGPCRIYDEHHRLMLEGKLASGKTDGIWTAYGSDGTPLGTWSYSLGLRDGPFQLWYGYLRYPQARGHLKLEGRFNAGHYEGPITRYYPSGGRQSVRVYDNGVLKSCQFWLESGSEATASEAQAEAMEEYRADMKFFDAYEDMAARSLTQAHRI